jgi:hypothetical protein
MIQADLQPDSVWLPNVSGGVTDVTGVIADWSVANPMRCLVDYPVVGPTGRVSARIVNIGAAAMNYSLSNEYRISNLVSMFFPFLRSLYIWHITRGSKTPLAMAGYPSEGCSENVSSVGKTFVA